MDGIPVPREIWEGEIISGWWVGWDIWVSDGYEEREEGESALEGLCGLQPAVCLAEEVGTGLGRGSLLQ